MFNDSNILFLLTCLTPRPSLIFSLTAGKSNYNCSKFFLFKTKTTENSVDITLAVLFEKCNKLDSPKYDPAVNLNLLFADIIISASPCFKNYISSPYSFFTTI